MFLGLSATSCLCLFSQIFFFVRLCCICSGKTDKDRKWNYKIKQEMAKSIMQTVKCAVHSRLNNKMFLQIAP